ncbi:efflux RND transporter periplasmic adaptor subunit [Paenibacillus chondroitinus]|uniref:Efflux RND transporter periplasmic adaptor subunit n=1 Tax=Paenibacillus chondroitinus TaxID=59842 RepID=A0ABU6DEA6_9BACL|nr:MULTISPECIES: efflux RND transporter periplasmic adaptor subunit [Paenibacillus]MCY9658760.1 efflux RND transporter periplasmic adaptor subunit [Paenibacillus anseongense]MEB4796014.1 efflux RND transporter periplasmic adaptor subunit [Paenibacillus chondroitinus]
MEKEPAVFGRKKSIQVVFLVFMGLLVFFSLFSNTLQSLALPKVRTEKPVKGSLLFSIEGSGSLQPFYEAKLSNTAGWKVQEILVKGGDHVKKGQPLIRYHSKVAEHELEDAITNLDKQNIELQNVQDQFIQSTMDGDDIKIRTARRDLETRKLDLAAQERKINELRDGLATHKEMTAPFDGLITKVNATEGLVSAGGPEILITNSSLGYRFDLSVDSTLLSSLGMSTGEKVEVEVHASQEPYTRIINGTIDEMADAEPRAVSSSDGEAGKTITVPQKVLSVKVVDAEVKGGEQVRIKLEKRSREEGWMISNEAIHQDRDGMFVYKLEEMRNALGNEFIVRKVRLQYSERNSKETMVQSDSLYEEDMVILESSEPLQDGNRVRLE